MLGFFKSFTSNIHYNYTVQHQPQFESGAWSVYDGRHKTSGEMVSVFVLNKKQMSKLLQNNGIEMRSDIWEQIKEFAARGVQQLAQIRHPSVLKLIELLESGKGNLSFVAERVVGTLDTVIRSSTQNSDLDDLTVVRGLTSVMHGLQFLHNNLGVAHLNITPRTIFIDVQGDWKLGGLEHIVKFEEYAPQSYHLPQLDLRLPSFVHPPYDYLAPELVIHKTVGPFNDVWGVACLLYAIYVRRSPMNTGGNPNDYKEEIRRFKSNLSTVTKSKFPEKLKPYVDSLFCEHHEGRITFEVLETTDFLQNPLIRALKSMDEYTAMSQEDKISFLKHLQSLLPQYPKHMRLRKIMNFTVKELKGPRIPATATLMGCILFSVCSDMSKLSFQEQVLPLFELLKDFQPFQESVSMNLEIVARNTSEKDFSNIVLPLLVDILKHSETQYVILQTQTLKSTAIYASNLTVPKMEQLLFPAIIDCFASTPARVVKTAATESLCVLVDRGVSKALVVDKLIPALQAMKTRDAIVVLAVADLWKSICSRLNSQQIFTLALPHLLDCSLAKQLTVDQFKEFIKVIREQIQIVETNQIKELKNNIPQNTDEWLEMESSVPTVISQEPENTSVIRSPISKDTEAINQKMYQKPVPLPKTSTNLPPPSNNKQPFSSSPVMAPSNKTSFPVLAPSKANQNDSSRVLHQLDPLSLTNSTPATNSLMNFAPLQPLKVSSVQKSHLQKSDDNDSFGAFTSSNNINSESLI